MFYLLFLIENFSVLQSPVLNGEVHTEEAEEITAGNSLTIEQDSVGNNLIHEENGHSHSEENHSWYGFLFSFAFLCFIFQINYIYCVYLYL